MLWDCYLYRPFRDQPLPDDANMRRLWEGVERFLVGRFPGSRRIVATFVDPRFTDEAYREFLGSLGYAPVAEAAYGKSLPSV